VTGERAAVFADAYVRAYDALYRDKDYAGECAVLERFFREYADREAPVRSVIDLGCGTGNHALPLARRGYSVVGVDSSIAAIRRAEAKAHDFEQVSLRFVTGDVRTVRLDQRFDAALMMFAVLGYQTENRDVLAALSSARALLENRGLLLFDVWYGPAVIEQGPSDRKKSVDLAEGQLVRAASGRLDTRRQLCRVSYELSWVQNGSVVERAEEVHIVRFFFPREIELLLETSGFSLLRLSAFPDVDAEPDLNSWNVIAVARAD
jgi:SAM-dependent methyltransferase